MYKFVSDLMLATGILTQNNRYTVSVWHRLIVISARLKKKHQNLKNYVNGTVYKYKSKYIAKYIRNTLFSRKQILKKTAFDTKDSPRHLNIVSDFHT